MVQVRESPMVPGRRVPNVSSRAAVRFYAIFIPRAGIPTAFIFAAA
jgi:hypothetical protein